MCGIVGVIGDMGKLQKAVFEQMLYADTFRGYDSTGIVSVGFQDQPRLYKKAVTGPDFLEFPRVQQLLNGKGIIGHNRWATKGIVNNVNAHPFQHGNFSGVHNGTLRGQYLLPDHKDYKVDSENIFHAFDKIGVEETVKNLHGAYALVWYNDKTETFHLLRNHERPLHYCFSKDNKHMYYASEAKMLDWILDRNRVQHNKIMECKEHHLLTIPMPKVGKAIGNISIRKLEHYVSPYNYNTSNNVSRLPSPTVHPDLKKLFGKVFDFQLGEKKSHFGRPYYELLPLDELEVCGKDLQVRIIDQKIFPELEAADREGKFFKAKLAAYSDKDSAPTYIIVISDSLVIYEDTGIEDEEEDIPFLFVGTDGVLLDEAEWKKATEKGCAWCASPAVASEDNLFVKEDEFICEGCQDVPNVKEFIIGGAL